MRSSAIFPAALAALVLSAWLSPALADSADANCEVRKEGETKHGASGPCSFSQRQGYIDIDLRNGDTYNLRPMDKANHYKDQKGIKVQRIESTSREQVFKWEGGKKITVTFASNSYSGNKPKHSYTTGDTAPDLSDLVGARAGQAEGELERRGYVYAKGSTSGNAKYSAYYNQSKGRCVMIRTEDGRYQSIVETPRADCGH
jgi:hypothetical protein